MSLLFDTRPVTVGDLLSETNVFDLPPFQRPFSWEPEIAAQLYDDLQTAYIHYSVENPSNLHDPVYFLGAIIVCKQGANSPFQIVDGQQRLITLSVILALLRDRVSNKATQTDIQRYLLRNEYPARGLQESPRLRIRSIDNASYISWIIKSNGTTQLPTAADTDSAQRLLEVIRRLRSELRSTTENYMSGIATFILNRCQFIVIESQSMEGAYRLFRGVNTPGQPLADIDLARAELVGPASGGGQDSRKLAETWDEIEDQIGIEELGRYVQTVAATLAPDQPGATLGELIANISSEPMQLVRFRGSLSQFLVSYKSLDSASLSIGDSDSSARINRIVSCLLALDNDEWRTAAVLWLTKSHTPKETYDFFRALDGLCLGMLILGTTRSVLKKRFKKIEERVLSGTVTEAGSEIYLRPDEKQRIRNIAVNPIRSSKKYLKPLLLRINAEITDINVQPNFPSGLTVEHILPQKPAKTSEWLNLFPDENERFKLTELLGNYALLTHKMNAKGKNAPFREKQKIYFDFKDHQAFPLTAQIVKYEEWTPSVIRSRQRVLLSILDQIIS